MYWRWSFLLIDFLVIFILRGVAEHCFEIRNPDENLGQCSGRTFDVDTMEECCNAGGSGWSAHRNGKRCEAACPVKFCFRTRTGKSQKLGSCTDQIGKWTKEDCCRKGGEGWTKSRTGKRCVDACEGVTEDGPVQFCFSRRFRRVGSCPLSSLLGEMTQLSCCRNGGVGWSAQRNGLECQRACEEDDSEAIDGGWSDWGEWEQCSATCGDGIQHRFRTCDNPTPQNGGADCGGRDVEDAICQDGPCPIDGGWGEWQPPGECSATCTTGSAVYRQQKRECNNPPPQFGGMTCSGPSIRNLACKDLSLCPVDGRWSEYDEWSACSQTCDNGTQTRSRTCSNPSPNYGGRQCEGESTEKQVCHNRRVCPTHGGWSNWGRWSPCSSRLCESEGSTFRYRSCTNPPPKDRGLFCIGRSVDRRTCRKCEDWRSGDWGSGTSSGSSSGDYSWIIGDGKFRYSYSYGEWLAAIEDLKPSIFDINLAHAVATDTIDSQSFSLDYSNVNSNIPQDYESDQPDTPQGRALVNENRGSDSYSFDDVSWVFLNRVSVDDSSL